MKQSPILFSTDMVKAILDGRKTMTRRIFKDHRRLASDVSKIDLKQWFSEYRDMILSYSPYGQVGDILWVRETFGYNRNGNIHFKVSVCSPEFDKPADGWKPSIHMPKAASRIWLQITDIRVERLQDITEEDCMKEGAKIFESFSVKHPSSVGNRLIVFNRTVSSFLSLWISLNGNDSFIANPWVWVISFKVLSTTGKPADL